jgi:O-antigen/teichoic acid export membrane protein
VRVWLGERYTDAAGLAAMALLSIMVVAPLHVGSNLLLGVGRAIDILRAAGAAIVVNLVVSLVLVRVVGIVGVFQATLLASAVLVPTLARAVLRTTGSNLGSFLRAAVVPVLLPTVALLAGAGAAVLLPLADLPTLIGGTVLGLGAYAAVAFRWAVDRSELAELRAAVSRQAGAE